MKKKKSPKNIFLFLVIVSGINSYIFINRNSYDFIKQSSYAELYPNTKQLSIHSYKVLNNNVLNIELNNRLTAPVNWCIYIDGIADTTYNSINPMVNLKEGIFTYTIKSSIFSDSLTIKAEYHPKEYYLNQESTSNNLITIYKSDLPTKHAAEHLKKWQNNSIEIDTKSLEELKRTLTDSVQIKPTDNIFTRAQKLSKFLCYRISSSKGVTSSKTVLLPVFQQYKAALLGNKIDCGIYANIFSLFASYAGITNRIIELKHRYGTFNENIHVFNEYFIDEQNQWAALDIMLNNISYTNGSGQLLNAVQVKNANSANNSITILQSALNGDSVINIPFPKQNPDFFNYYNIDKDLIYYTNNKKNIYTFKEKFKRFFCKNPWYEVYSDTKIVDNKLFYIKQLFILLELVICILFLLNVFIKPSNNKID